MSYLPTGESFWESDVFKTIVGGVSDIAASAVKPKDKTKVEVVQAQTPPWLLPVALAGGAVVLIMLLRGGE